MQLSNQSPGCRSRTLWVWTTLLLLLAVTTTTTPGGGQVQAAESPQQQPRDLSLLNQIKDILEELKTKLVELLNPTDPPTTSLGIISSTTESDVTNNPVTTPGGTEITGSTADSAVTTDPVTTPGVGKRSLSMTRKLLEEEVCKTESDDDHCVKLKDVIKTIEDVTSKLERGEVTDGMLTDLEDANDEMDTVLENVDGIDINKEILSNEINDVEDAIKMAQDDIDTQNNNSQTLVIVLGSVGGFIVVALVATIIFAYYKKKTSIDDKQKLNTEYVPINSFKEDGHDNPNFYPEVVTAQRPAQPQEVKTYGTPSHLQPKSSLAQDNSNSQQNYYEAPAYSKVDDPESQNVPQRTSYRGGYATETQGQQPTYSRPAADKVPRPNVYGNTNKQPPRPVSGANYDTDHRSPSRPTSKTASDYERKPNRSGYESDVRVPPRVAPKPISSRPNNPPARSYDDEANDPYSLVGRGNIKRMSGAPAGGLRRIDN